ncbi:MAG: hypothetical protein IJR14_04615 [Synergistaceae bacterium]|nr:hypothetical protein [Synergistaceae bacterium]
MIDTGLRFDTVRAAWASSSASARGAMGSRRGGRVRRQFTGCAIIDGLSIIGRLYDIGRSSFDEGDIGRVIDTGLRFDTVRAA